MTGRTTIAFLIVGIVGLPAAPQQRFEVSSITECPTATLVQTDAQFRLGAVRPVYLRIERTRMGITCVTVESLIHMAYNGGRYGHVNAAGRDVRGGPDWVRSEHYSIEGSADGVQNPDLLGAMLRSFLEDRFHLRVRRHTDDAPMYALKVAPGGLKITPMASSDCVATSDGVPSASPQTPVGTQVPCGTFKCSMDRTLRVCDAVPATLTTVANLFDLDRHVIDQTGVKDRFAIHLEVETDPQGVPAATLIKALEQQLGLTLVSTKGKRSWVQIERIDKPTLR